LGLRRARKLAILVVDVVGYSRLAGVHEARTPRVFEASAAISSTRHCRGGSQLKARFSPLAFSPERFNNQRCN
jgi:hypothetical protein